jgi:chromosome segregation ATPase
MSNNNNNTDDIDEYEYVSYADKYFGEQLVNETIHTKHPSQPIIPEFTEQDIFQKFFKEYDSDVTKLRNEINDRQERIDIIKAVLNDFYDDLTELQTKMRNLSNNNNNNNVDLNIADQIKFKQLQIDVLTNDIEDLEIEQITSKKKVYTYLIEDRQKYINQLKETCLRYNKIASKEPEEREKYENLIQDLEDEINVINWEIIHYKNIISTLPILVPKVKGYEIQNGLIGAKRDINIKLMSKLKNEEDIRQFTGINGEYNTWKDHFLFEILKNAGPKFIKHSKSKGFDV